MSIYNNVKVKCAEKHITVLFLEKKLNFPRSSICKWDKNVPGVEKVKAVADVLECTVDELLK